MDTLALVTAWSVVGLTAVVLFLNLVVSPKVDALEPPLLKPRIPLIGHAIAMLREKSGFYDRVFAESKSAMCTIPVMSSKLYIVNSPALIHAANCNKDISFQPFVESAYKHGFAMDPKQMSVVESETERNELMVIMRSTLLGEGLRSINIAALNHMVKVLNGVESKTVLTVPDTFLWLRRHLTSATSRALYGEKSPLTEEHHHLVWEFDQNFVLLTSGFAPNLLAPKSVAARGQMERLLIPYYQAKYDELPSTSEIVRRRAEILRGKGFNDEQLGRQEMFLLWAAVPNTGGMIFWAMVQLFSRPEYVSRVRSEFEEIITMSQDAGKGRVGTVPATGLEKACPVLNAFYQETLRYDLNAVGARKVMKDTTIRDPDDGREYLLKKGGVVQWASQVTGFLKPVWGEDTSTFNPERFLKTSSQDAKLQRGAQIPFGGGKHLCPGRFLASAEILGFLGVLAAGFEVEHLSLPDSANPKMGAAPREAVWGSRDPGFSLRRREGWEDVLWNFN